jgi:hypothetical protein
VKSPNSLFVYLILGVFAAGLGIGGTRWMHQRNVRRQVDELLSEGRRWASTGDYEGVEYHFRSPPGKEDQLSALGHEALPRLRDAIASNEPSPRFENAMVMLGELGSIARLEAPFLLSVIGTPPSSEALWALGELGDASPEVLSRLSQAILDDTLDETRRITALGSLVKLSPGSPALAHTLKAIDDLKDHSGTTERLKQQCERVRVGRK